jgi:hypothetical protein
MLQQGWHLVKNSSFSLAHYLSNVHSHLPLEAPREYVQHGPLLSINYWLRLCPQFGARVRSHAVRRRLFIVLMTAAHISPNIFSHETSSATYMYCFLRYIQHLSYLLYITFTRTILSFIYMTHSHFHSFRSSWQAGCPRSLVSDTSITTIPYILRARINLSLY